MPFDPASALCVGKLCIGAASLLGVAHSDQPLDHLRDIFEAVTTGGEAIAKLRGPEAQILAALQISFVFQRRRPLSFARLIYLADRRAISAWVSSWRVWTDATRSGSQTDVVTTRHASKASTASSSRAVPLSSTRRKSRADRHKPTPTPSSTPLWPRPRPKSTKDSLDLLADEPRAPPGRARAWCRSSLAIGAISITMIAISITPAAHQAIKTSLLGTADATPRPGPDGLIRIWLDRKFVDRLRAMRGPGESYNDVTLLGQSQLRPPVVFGPVSLLGGLQALFKTLGHLPAWNQWSPGRSRDRRRVVGEGRLIAAVIPLAVVRNW